MEHAAIREQLTGPGGPFEIGEEDVLGVRLPVVKDRLRSLREMLEQSAAHGEKEYLVHGDVRVTYAAHLRRVASVARALQERFGVGPGDRVAILAANCPEWVISFWATLSLGAVVSALNGWWTADEIRYGVAHSTPTLLIGDRSRLARLAGRDLGVPVVEIEGGFAALADHAPEAGLPTVPIAEDDPAVILYTSGTTGRPRGAVNSHRGICGFVQTTMLSAVERMIAAAQSSPAPPAPAPATSEPPPQTCALVSAPLFHMSGMHAMAVMMLATGGKAVFRSGRFDPEDVLRLIERERVTTWAALGAMAPRVIDHASFPRYDVSSVTNVGFGGAPTSPALQERIRAAFPNAAGSIGLGYGLSESVASVASIGGAELEKHPTSVGRIAPTSEVEIRDDQGKPCPEGIEGEIHVRSPYLMLGYWADAEATAKAILPGRWLATGDIGHMEEGRLYINARARDLILRAAENVYPAEIEQRLDAHPSVAESAVFGVEHATLGQEVKAIVVPAHGARPESDELARWTAETLAAYKVPSVWEVREEPLPRNAAGKVLKDVLKGTAENTFIDT